MYICLYIKDVQEPKRNEEGALIWNGPTVHGLEWRARRTGADWTGLAAAWNGAEWLYAERRLIWTGPDWTGPDRTGLDRTGLQWTGLEWTGLGLGAEWTSAM